MSRLATAHAKASVTVLVPVVQAIRATGRMTVSAMILACLITVMIVLETFRYVAREPDVGFDVVIHVSNVLSVNPII
jgi:hypothetical protein